VRKPVFLALILFVGACQAKKVEPPVINRTASKELQNFKNEVCPAALNGLRAVTEDRVMNPENFKDTTVMMDLRETAAMLEMVMAECVRVPNTTPNTTVDTTTSPDSASEKSEEPPGVRIARSSSSVLPTAR